MNKLAKITEAILKSSMSQDQWEQYSQAMGDKYRIAISAWAVAKMGEEREKYLQRAFELFLINLAVHDLLAMLESGMFWQCLEQIPLIIPQDLKKSVKIPLAAHDPDEIAREYKKAHAVVKAVRKKTWKRLRHPGVLRGPLAGTTHNLAVSSNRNKNIVRFIDEIKSKWPGYPPERMQRALEQNWKDSYIAWDYIIWRFGMPGSVESVRKEFALTTKPEKLFENIKLDLFKCLKSGLVNRANAKSLQEPSKKLP